MAVNSSESPSLVASPKIGGLFHLILSILFPWKRSQYILRDKRKGSTLVTLLSQVILRTFDYLNLPMAILGNCLEFFLNLLNLNGEGILPTLWEILRGKLKVPRVGSEKYFSLVGLLDYDLVLDNHKLDHYIDMSNERISTHPTNAGNRYFAFLSIMASKLAYENQLVIKDAITRKWEMHFLEFFACWNAQLGRRATEAFMFSDREKDARVVVLAFRGTEPFDADDWKTDFDFSFFNWEGFGKVHYGFLEALGLAKRGNEIRGYGFLEALGLAKYRDVKEEDSYLTDLDFDVQKVDAHERGYTSPLLLPKSGGGPLLDTYDQKSDPLKPLAFYAIVEKLIDVMEKNVNAKFIVTGHSLGAALATLFLGIICGCRDQDLRNKKTMLMDRLFALYTFGQPRVGDFHFANFLKKNLNKKYFRVAYSYDIVPKVPFDDKEFQYKHFGEGHLFDNFYNETNLPDELTEGFPRNFWIESVRSFFPMRWVALLELWGALLRPVVEGKEGWKFIETKLSIISRIFGLFFPEVSAHAPKNYVNSMISVRGKLQQKPSRKLFVGAYNYQK